MTLLFIWQICLNIDIWFKTMGILGHIYTYWTIFLEYSYIFDHISGLFVLIGLYQSIFGMAIQGMLAHKDLYYPHQY